MADQWYNGKVAVVTGAGSGMGSRFRGNDVPLGGSTD
jgi:hypothetical protein